MPIVHPSIEDSANTILDPYDWSVEEVISALCNHNSRLRTTYGSQSFPNEVSLASKLREHDVTGLALLQNVDTACLKNEFGIKSMGQRACLEELIEALQQESLKYQERQNRRSSSHAARSSIGWSGRVGTPYLSTLYEAGAPPGDPGPWRSPRGIPSGWQDTSLVWESGLGTSERTDNKPRDIPREVPPLPRSDWTTPRGSVALGKSCSSGSNVDRNESSRCDSKLEQVESKPGALSATALTAEISANESLSHNHNGETTIIDDHGQRRRRLAPTLLTPSALKSGAEVASNEKAANPIGPEVMGSYALRDGRSLPTNAATVFQPQVDERHLISSGLGASADDTRKPRASRQELFMPGVIHNDEQGRKRVTPILQVSPEVDVENRSDTTGEGSGMYLDSDSPRLPVPEATGSPTTKTKVVSLGKKAQRQVDQIYLGFEPLGVDELFYGKTELEHSLDEVKSSFAGEEAGLDKFILTNPNGYSAAQKRYVHSRMKYYLQSPRVDLRPTQAQGLGILPYPNRIARKYYPLSMTVFKRTTSGNILVLRANRAKWIEDASIPKLSTVEDSNTSNVFNVPDLALAMDDHDDSEWKALEKWKYMDGDDVVLPTYGESSSEGEYDLDTWKEMEQEAGELKRAEGRSKKRLMTQEEVQAAINAAIEGIVEQWKNKMQPRLRAKAMQLWMKSRRDKSKNAQLHLIDETSTALKSRLDNLRCEIAKEDWSKSSKLSHQCKIMQPSIFDLETLKWKRDVLQLPKAPAKVAIVAKQRKAPPSQRVDESPLANGEELIATGSDDDSISGDTLDGFIVEDGDDASKPIESILDDDHAMADIEDAENGIASDTLIQQPCLNAPWRSPGQSNAKPTSHTPKASFLAPKATPPNHNIIDLTQVSSDNETFNLPPKSEQTFDIKTPPVNSGSDTDIFSRAGHKKRPVFKLPPPLSQGGTQIIDLENTTNDEIEQTRRVNEKPAHNNVDAIKKMDPTIFLEQQDRKRLLVWIIAHTPPEQRGLAMRYLTDLSMEVLQKDVLEALNDLIAHRQRLRRMNCERSDSMMQIAAWFVSWSMVVKYSASGLAKEHVEATIDDIEGFEDFYDFLLLCLKYYEKTLSLPTPPKSASSQKQKKQKIIRDDSTGNVQDTPFRRRVYAVPVSEETLNKTQSALERQLANEQRRKEELKLRRANMPDGKADVSDVIVNPGKLRNQEFIRLDSKFGDGAHVKPHQEEGLQFLWREITADHEDLQGCLLAQTMGLGKTMQVIALLVTLSQAGKSSNQGVREQIPPSLRESHALVLCPPALVENWWDEFLFWVPNHLDSIGSVHKISAVMKLDDRVAEILAWDKNGGILILGYAAFRRLLSNKGRKTKGGMSIPPPLEEKIHKLVKAALLDGARLVVADEAHEFKNAQSDLNLAMNQIKTKSRIALTGSPLANNLGEYYSLVDWVAPKYLGTPSEFRATYQEDIDAGLYRDSTDTQYREARKRLKALELVMGPKVHRADVSALHNALHGKMEFVIKVPLTPLQSQLYRLFVEATLDASAKKEPQRAVLWTWLHILQLLCNHPKLFREKLLTVKAEMERLPGQKRPLKKSLANSVEDNLIASDDDDAVITDVSSQGALGRIIAGAQETFDNNAESIDSKLLSNKMQVLMTIIECCGNVRDKLLVFSHRIPTLDYIADQLREGNMQFERIDGTVDPQKRQAVTKSFNEKDLSICLISTRAGGQGLNLFGANRVVILDDWFNPMWEQQAIGRAYRIGQRKPVYVYRLTTAGTFEQAIQNQSLFKEQLATRVVDKKNPIRSAKRGAGQYLFIPKQHVPDDLQDLKGKDALVLDHLLAARERYGT